ncbi:organoarsenical effux MFS transporter ArsJ [Shewanella waksmanii]|uniref:organoarsenical effux MFS transporter ArsJ n=1 Tax=Shewanella waksmanii TaxID=213783 RepID=UPI003736B59C
MLASLQSLPTQVRQYMLVTANYWAFTLTDGALRMLVVLYFHQLGYSPLAIAMLFLFYEFFGVVTNLFGGYLGARFGLNRTMNIGLGLQILALLMLLVPTEWLTIAWVMVAQALSGIAKDLNKMSAKSSIKALVAKGAEGTLYKYIALLTGSKNTLKGVGFFLGGVLLALFGFHGAVLLMALGLTLVWCVSLIKLKQDLGKASTKPKFKQIFSKSRNINILSAARMCLFSARDVWFVVALPVYLASQFGWDHYWVGGFLATWVIAYGVVQSLAPKITGSQQVDGATAPGGRAALFWAFLLTLVPIGIAMAMSTLAEPQWWLIIGLIVFGVVFAINSSLHSYLIVSYASDDGVSLDVGFYYMANAMGRLIGTILSGWIYQSAGLVACLWVAAGLLVVTTVISYYLPDRSPSH